MSRVLLVTFASGFAALSYEVVWLSVLSTVVGGTTVAAAATLAVFFLGLGIGSAVGGRVARRTRAPLRVCVAVELGIALCAGIFLLLLGPTSEIYRQLFASIGHGATVMVALVLLLPPSALMGATLPLVAEALVQRSQDFGRQGSLIYASNTLGGATGAALSAFYLIAEFGVQRTCAVAALLNVGAAGCLLTIPAKPTDRASGTPARTQISRLAILLAAGSGFCMLALEVIWTRMLVQVVHNSVYTFGAILLVFLVSLGLGSWLAAYGVRFQRFRRMPRHTAAMVALIAMVAVVWSARGFPLLTDGFQRIRADGGFVAYMLQVVLVSAATFLPAAIVGGMLFPLALQMAAPSVRSAGSGLGVLGAANTLAAIAGSLAGGFVLVRAPFGLFDALAWIAGLYGLIGILLISGSDRRAYGLRFMALASGAAAVLALLGLPPPIALKNREQLIDFEQGVGGIVAVTEKRRNRKIKINNHYTLGSTRAVRYQRRQAQVPLILHPNPENVLFIGLGTGLTADAALDFEALKRLTVVELTEEVVELASQHFSEQARKLYSNPRATIVAADARHYLATHNESFDVVVGDLFVPWRSGVGNLYSREHFAVVRSRLRPGGLFAQWVPLYQMSSFELAVVARTMLSVFGEISIWRCEFEAKNSILAMVGRAPDGPGLDLAGVAARAQEFAARDSRTPSWMEGYGFFELLAGRLDSEQHPFVEAPLNTDQHPIISFQAPRTHREVLGGDARWVSGRGYQSLLRAMKNDSDPTRDAEAERHFEAGYWFHEREIRKFLKQDKASKRAEREYLKLRDNLVTTGR